MQNREPPAYLEYAAAMLASRPKRMMTATELGVAWAMKLECWVNRSLPAEPGALAIILGLDPGEVAAALPAVMPLFAYVGEEIVCPELDRYREHIEMRHSKLSESGKAGAAAKGRKQRKQKNGDSQGIPGDATISATTLQPGLSQASATLKPLNTIQPKPNQSNPPSVKEVPPDPWVKDYSEAQRVTCSEEAYRKASRGE